MNNSRIIEETKNQVLRKKDVNGADVAVWLFRHAAYLAVVLPIFLAIFAYIWPFHIAPKVDARAARLDTLIVTPIKNDVKKIKRRSKETHYIVKKMEIIQRKTAPRNVVEDAQTEIDLQKERDSED
jgi:hypothetical protein